MKKLKRVLSLGITLALLLALAPAALAKTTAAGQTAQTVLFYTTNTAGERILVAQIPVAEMESDMQAGKIDQTLHNYSILDRFVTTVHQESQGFLVPDFVSYAQGKSTDAAIKAAPFTFDGEDTISFWEIDQAGYDDMDRYTYNDLYGVPRYNFPLLYQYWDYRTQDYYDPAGKLTRDEVIDHIFQNGEKEVFLLSVRAFSQRYIVTESKYGTGDYNMEGIWQSLGLLDNERTMRIMKPMTKEELYQRQPTAADTRYWISQILLEMNSEPNIASKGTVAAPTATMTEDQNNYYIRFSCDTPGASIYYNHNYISPSYMPTSLYKGNAVTVPKSWFPSGTVTMTAHGVKDGWSDAGTVTLSLEASGTETGQSHLYPDVEESAWYYDAVSYVAQNGLFDPQQDGNFGPQAPMTRLMLAEALYRLSGSPAVEGKGPFVDTTAPSVVWAYNQGVVAGTSATTFSPKGTITREQIASMLYRYAAQSGQSSGQKGDLSRFSDGASVASWAKDAMEWATGVTLISGTGTGALQPQDTASRSQVAQILLQFSKL